MHTRPKNLLPFSVEKEQKIIKRRKKYENQTFAVVDPKIRTFRSTRIKKGIWWTE
ncbi:hypothetical protein MARVELLAND_7 [Bacillus phage vB_BspM_MarvelLand]|nr:hypothetical protein MARVELLAND_7 [Bacillus phage vB_BspM_MarvelLand]